MTSLVKLGIRLAFSAGREHRWRQLSLFLASVVVATILCGVAGAFNMFEREQAREVARTGVIGEAPSDRALLIVRRADVAAGRQFDVVWIEPVSLDTDPVLPPGLDAMPAQGEKVVSPRLAQLARDNPEIGLRYPLTSKVLPAAAMPNPNDLFAYARPQAGHSIRHSDGTVAAVAFGAVPGKRGTISVAENSDRPTVQAVIATTGFLGVPMLLLMFAAAATLAPTRDRRMLVLKWLGVRRSAQLLVLTVETLCLVVPGALLAAAACFMSFPSLAAVPLTERMVVQGDVALSIPQAISISAVTVALGAAAGVLVIFRARGVAASRPQPAMEVLSYVRLVPFLGGLAVTSFAYVAVGRLRGTLALAGTLLVLLGLPLVLPHLVRMAGAALRRRPSVFLLLAGRSLERSPTAVVRPLFGVVTLIVLCMATVGVISVLREDDPVPPRDPMITVLHASYLNANVDDLERLRRQLPGSVAAAYDIDFDKLKVRIATSCRDLEEVGAVRCDGGSSLPEPAQRRLSRLFQLPQEFQFEIIRSLESIPESGGRVAVLYPSDRITEGRARAVVFNVLTGAVVVGGSDGDGGNVESPVVFWLHVALLMAAAILGGATMLTLVDGFLRSSRDHWPLLALGLNGSQVSRLELARFVSAYVICAAGGVAIGTYLCFTISVVGGNIPMPLRQMMVIWGAVVVLGVLASMSIRLLGRLDLRAEPG